jgi:hypothetical protein
MKNLFSKGNPKYFSIAIIKRGATKKASKNPSFIKCGYLSKASLYTRRLINIKIEFRRKNKERYFPFLPILSD